jgi:hypothetical protein
MGCFFEKPHRAFSIVLVLLFSFQYSIACRRAPMLQIIALTQFVFLALGSMGVTVLLKASGYPLGSMKDYPALSLFLMQNSVWLLLVPILWSVYAYASQKVQRGFVSSKFAIPIGIALTVLIFLTYAWAIVGHF